MSGVTTQLAVSVGGAQSQCPACDGRLTRPFLLPCLHPICHSCLTVNQASDRHAHFTCPVCHEQAPSNARNMGTLPEDYFLRHVQEANDCQEDAPKLCDYCRGLDGGERAEQRCLECRDNLCSSCTDAHKRTKVTRNHPLVSLHDLQIGENKHLRQIRGYQRVQCSKHPDDTVRFFCVECDVLLCRECKVTLHDKHKYDDLERIGSNFQQKMNPLLDTMSAKSQSIEAQLAQMEEYLSVINETRTKLESEINAKAGWLHEEIDKHRATLIAGLNDACNDESARVAQKQNQAVLLQQALNNASSYTTKLFFEGKSAEIIAVKQVVKDRLTKLSTTQMEPLGTKLVLTFITDSPSALPENLQTQFGKIEIRNSTAAKINSSEIAVRNGEPKLAITPAVKTRQFLKQAQLLASFECRGLADSKDIWPTGLAVHPDTSHVYIVDRENRCVKVHETTSSGRLLREFGRGFLGCPYDVTVLNGGNLAVSDHESEDIKTFTMTGELLTTLRNTVKYPRGVATDLHGNVIAVDAHDRQIKILDPSTGHEVKTIYGRESNGSDVFKDPYYVTVNKNGLIFVTDWGDPYLKVFNPDGRLLSGFGDNRDKISQPYGICSDHSGNILVADNQNHRIQLLNQDGDFVRFVVTKQQGLWHPMAIEVNKNGHLIVTEALGKVKVFKYLI